MSFDFNLFQFFNNFFGSSTGSGNTGSGLDSNVGNGNNFLGSSTGNHFLGSSS